MDDHDSTYQKKEPQTPTTDRYTHMKSMITRITLTVILLQGIPPIDAEESTRIAVLRMTSKAAASVRAELNDPVKGTKEETMDAVIKRGGVTAIARFNEMNPWRDATCNLIFPQGKKFFDLKKPHPFVSLELQGRMQGSNFEERFSSDIQFPTKGKNYWLLQCMGGSIPSSGRWLEKCYWSDGKETVTLWEFSMVDREPEASSGVQKPLKQLKLEILWLRANPGDLKTLEKATPKTREKASKWISKRAAVKRSCMFRMTERKNQKTLWYFTDGTIQGKRESLYLDEERFSVINRFTEIQEPLKAEWEVSFKEKGEKMNTTRKMTAVVTPGIWNFQFVKDIQDVNVVAYRFSNDEN